MASETTYRVDDCTDISVVASIDTMYVLDDGYLLRTLVRDAYCKDCRTIELVELLPDVETLEDEFSEDDTRLILDAEEGTTYFNAAMERKRRLEWRQSREAPARCINCGSFDYFPLGPDEVSIDPVTCKKFVWTNCVFFDSNQSLSIRLRPDGTVITTWKIRIH